MKICVNSVKASLVCSAVMLSGSVAGAANPLTILESLTPTDSIATGFDGPNAPAPDTFYYDLYTFTVDTAGNYDFTMNSLALGLAPWIGVYDNNFNPSAYFSPAPIDLVANALGGTTISMTLPLTPGTYQAIASSVDWIEEPDALDEGAYSVVISGPAGSDIRLVPAPATLAVLGIAGAACRRRRK